RGHRVQIRLDRTQQMHPLVDVGALSLPCLAPPILRQVLDLGRLQIDQVGVIDDELDVGASKLTQDRIYRRLDVGTGQVKVQGCRPAVESRLQEFEFAAEVVVDAGSCDADSGTDVVQADAGETPDGEHANGLGEQCFPPGAAPYGGVRGSGGAREVGGHVRVHDPLEQVGEQR